tara:strand:+ start:190 stop:549 length:360 start_codon:yes stop_codon:yes gene_type:complete
MAYQLRKVERYTNWEATKAVTLNPDDFTTLSTPYTGTTEEEFMNYIQELYHEDWYEICDELEELGSMDSADALSTLFEGEMEIYSSTTEKEEDMWVEVGEVNEEYSKYGGFKSNFNTMG